MELDSAKFKRMINQLLRLVSRKQYRIALDNSVAAAIAELKHSLRCNEIPIARVETVSAFESWSSDLGIWMFYETDEQRDDVSRRDERNGVVHLTRDALIKHGFPSRLIRKVTFTFDSNETVVRDYEGNYCYRLR